MCVVQSIKEALDVHFEHPPSASRHEWLPECLQRLVSQAPRPEAEGAGQEVLLVDGFQDHYHRTLKDLILECRDPDGPRFRPIALRNMDPSDGRRSVGPGFQAIE